MHLHETKLKNQYTPQILNVSLVIHSFALLHMYSPPFCLDDLSKRQVPWVQLVLYYTGEILKLFAYRVEWFVAFKFYPKLHKIERWHA